MLYLAKAHNITNNTNTFIDKLYNNKILTYNNTINNYDIVNEFDNSPDNTIFILFSCRSLNESIDVKNCNCICFW